MATHSSILAWRMPWTEDLFGLQPMGSQRIRHNWVTLLDPVDCILLGSSDHGILQVRKLEGVAFPFSRGSSQPRDQIWVSCIAGGFFTIWATREALCFSAKTMSQHTVISFHRSNRELLNGNSKQLRSCFHWGLLIFFFSLLTGTCQEKVSK